MPINDVLCLTLTLANDGATPCQPERAERDTNQQHGIRLRYGATAARGTLKRTQHTLGLDRIIERAVEEREANRGKGGEIGRRERQRCIGKRCAGKVVQSDFDGQEAVGAGSAGDQILVQRSGKVIVNSDVERIGNIRLTGRACR